MAGYLGSRPVIVQVDGYQREESESRYVNVSGDDFSGHLDFVDDAKARFGSSDELHIYTESSGSGHSYIQGDNIVIRSAAGTARLTVTSNDVDVSSGALKIGGTTVINSSRAITATGAAISGAVELGSTDSTVGDLRVYDTGNNSLRLFGVGSNSFEFDLLGTGSTGKINFSQYYVGISTSNPVAPLVISNGGASGIEFHPEIANNYNRMTNYNRSSNSYNQLGIDASHIDIRPEGTRRFSVTTAGAIVNLDARADADFRVVSDSNSHMLFVDSSKNKVCFGTNSTPYVNANSTNVYEAVVNNGISIGDTNYTHGFIGTGGTDGNVVIAANAYPANLGAERYVIIETGSAGGGGPNEVARFSNGEGVIFNNDNSNVKDFQVKTASENYCLFVDAGHNKIGMGMSDPSSYGSRLAVEMNGGSNSALISCINSATSGTRRQIDFFDGTSTSRKGAIETNGTSTTYNTTSDRRLKTDIQPIEGATATLMAMAPVTHKWKAHPSAPAVYGFIAQDMQALVPEAVSGDPDSDEMMSMDYGRITPVLVAALQDAHKKIAALEERLTDLGGRS